MTEDSPPLRWMIHVAGPKVSHLVAQYETECGTNAGTEQISHHEETEQAQKLLLVKVEKATKNHDRHRQAFQERVGTYLH